MSGDLLCGTAFAFLLRRTSKHDELRMKVNCMSQRENKLLWLKDVLGHLRSCQKQLEWAEASEAVHVLTDTMLRDLDCCRRICESLKRRVLVKEAA